MDSHGLLFGRIGLVDVEEFIACKQGLSIPLPSCELIELFLLRGIDGLKVFQADSQLARAGLASKCQPIGMMDSILETIGRFDENSRGEGFGLLDHEGTVEHEKLLLGDCGFGSDRSGDICVGKIEQPEHVVQLVSADERIDCSSVVARVGKIRRRPLELAVQSSGGRKERIAPSLDVEPTPGHSPEVSIVSVDLLIRIIAIRAELVGRREHDLTVKGFD